jgi:hypothetical protein
MVETLTEDVNFLAGSGSKAGIEEFGVGGSFNNEFVDKQ